MASRIRKRYAAERRFRLLGFAAVALSVGFLAFLLVTMAWKGLGGFTRIEAKGQPLDPNKHQAMIEIPSDAEAGTIIEEMQAGYMLKDRLLRPALVAVAKRPD